MEIEKEEENIGMKYYLNFWLSKIEALNIKEREKRNKIYIEALKFIPNSYKITKMFLEENMMYLKNKCILNKKFKETENYFERALNYLYKMPRIWIMYSEFLKSQGKIKKMILILNRALKNLSIIQHEKIWEIYIPWLKKLKIKKLAEKILEKYIKYNEYFKEEYIEYLLENKNIKKAVIFLIEIINNSDYYPIKNNKYEYSMKVCKLISENSIEIENFNTENIFKYCLKKYSDEIGNIWVFYANFFLGKGNFEKTRSIFQKAVLNVNTRKDFGIVYNAFLNFEEGLAMVLMEKEEDEVFKKEKIILEEIDQILGFFKNKNDNFEIPNEEEIQLRRINDLLQKREFYLNDCVLRQNSNIVKNWINKFNFVEKKEKVYLDIFLEALKKINFDKADGNVSDLFIFMADFFKEKKDFKKMNFIYEKSFSYDFRKLEEYETLVLNWMENLLIFNYEKDVLKLLKIFLNLNKNKKTDFIKDKILNYLKNSQKLWSLYIDILHNTEKNEEKIIKNYDILIKKKNCTGLNIINYLNFLDKENKKNKFYSVCEIGINQFEWPICGHIWLIYLKKTEEIETEKNIERLRELYERVVSEAPISQKFLFYLLFLDFEKKKGMINHQMEIFKKMIKDVEDKKKLITYKLYIAKTSKYFGIQKTREIYENFIKKNLKVEEKINLGLEYAKLELKLKEIDRARKIYFFLSQFCEPEIEEYGFWKIWEDFEIEWGNEDTYRDFIRNKKSIKKEYDILPPTLKRVRRKIEIEEKENGSYNN